MNTINEISWVTPKAIIKTSRLHGKGIFASENIDKDEKVVVWGGLYVNHVQAISYQNRGFLIMQWDDDLYSVEKPADDDSYFINHSCDPNLWMSDTFTLVARRHIKVGEELTADYCLWEADEKYISKWECRCGTSFCRGRVTGIDWRDHALQKRYQNHFSPLINKRIMRLAKFIENKNS